MLGQAIFITGVRKSGTTTLYDSLTALPVFRPGRVKEPQFFVLPDDTVARHADWYLGLYDDGAGDIPLDGSTLYYQFPESYERIRRHIERPFFLCCLRDPAQRFFSAYWHLRAKPGNVERRSFEEVLASYEKWGGEAEDEILAQAVRKKKIDVNYLNQDYLRKHYQAPFDTEVPDPLIFFRYYGESRYSRQCDALRAQPHHRVVLFEDLVSHPEQTLHDVLEHLEEVYDLSGVATAEEPPQLAPNNNRTLNANASLLMRTVAKLGWYDYLKRYLGERGKQRVKSLFYGATPRMTREQYDRLRALLAEEYAFWGKEMPRTLEIWRFRS